MKTLLKISWRNIWRNKARSIVIILAIGFGLWGGISATALISGMLEQQFNSGIKNQVSHIQIHNPEYIREKETKYDIGRVSEIYGYLNESEKVYSYSARTLASGMLATASMTSGVEIFGIYTEQENKTTAFENNMTDGDYFESVSRNPILIGETLANKMKISTGNRIVMTFQDVNNDIVSASFRVCGIYRTANSVNDQRNVYIKQSDLNSLLGTDGLINEIAILLHDIDEVNTYKSELQSKFPETEVRTWAEVAPDLSFLREFSGVAMMVLLVIILLALAFGLLNTMLMTIFERTRELGVLMSIGMNKGKVFLMILLETSFLVITGSVFGTIIGATTVSVLGKTGLDLTSMGADTLSEFGFEAVFYPSLEPAFYLNLAIMVLVTAFIAAIYPAYKALKLNPAEAVRKE